MPWLAARRSPPSTPLPCDAAWRRADPARFAEALAALGPVFCAWRETVAAGGRMPDTAVLSGPGLLGHGAAVTPDGPREWITVCDRGGRARCRLHLLPDTDYLAWDTLIAGTRAHDAATPMGRPAPRWQATFGRRLCLAAQPIGPWRLVVARPAPATGALGWRAAQLLAAAEGVTLVR